MVVNYYYDAYGVLLQTGGTMAATLGTLNPLTYRGYVYDHETGLYYLQSRYYNPEIRQFISPDALISTGQGILGYNMFAYCLNNPVNRADPTGYRMETVSILAGDSPQKRDVTDEVATALIPYLNVALAMRIRADTSVGYRRIANVAENLQTFYSWVNHGATWDIKLEEVWVETINTPFPGVGTEVLFFGQSITPEKLGNVTYAIIGGKFGFPLSVLFAGSYVAAKAPIGGDELINELQDWPYIFEGYMTSQF